jgi:hypothetical protein
VLRATVEKELGAEMPVSELQQETEKLLEDVKGAQKIPSVEDPGHQWTNHPP